MPAVLAVAMATVKEGVSYIYIKGNGISDVSSMDASCEDAIRIDPSNVTGSRNLIVESGAVTADAYGYIGMCSCCIKYAAENKNEEFCE